MNPPIHGLLAEFGTAAEVLAAVRQARQAGYRALDAYTPYPVEGLPAALGLAGSRIPSLVLIGGLVGGAAGYLMQYWSMAVDYPYNAGGRPHHSWPAFMPVAFEVMILVAALAAFLGMLFLNGLPQPHHPVFNVERFARASQDRFFVCIEATDPLFDRQATAAFLAELHPTGEVMEVPHE